VAKFSLIPFDSSNSPTQQISVDLNQTDHALYISYKLTGDLSQIDIGNGTPNHQRQMKLWEKTCFELFLKHAEHEDYLEFNFSPLFEWNSFYFPHKGAPLKEFEAVEKIKIDILRSSDVFQLIAEIESQNLPRHFQKASSEGKLLAGITTVLKEKNLRMSYWALAHKDQKPNFHHFDSFIYKF
jgi:hypothetical protein